MGCVVIMGVCVGASWRATGGDSLKVANGVYLELGHVVGALSPMLFNKPFCSGTKTSMPLKEIGQAVILPFLV